MNEARLDWTIALVRRARHVAQRVVEALRRVEGHLEELREPETLVVFEDPGPCRRCHDPLGRGFCEECAADMQRARFAGEEPRA